MASSDKRCKGNPVSIEIKAVKKDSHQSIVQRDVEAETDYNLKKLPHLTYMKYYRVSQDLRNLLEVNIGSGLDICSVEVGGGGDCGGSRKREQLHQVFPRLVGARAITSTAGSSSSRFQKRASSVTFPRTHSKASRGQTVCPPASR